MDLDFLSMRQEILLQALPSEAEQRIVAKFIRSDFRPLSRNVLKLAAGLGGADAIAQLVLRGWLERRKDRYRLASKVVNHLRDRDQEDSSNVPFLSKEASQVVELFSNNREGLLPYSLIWQELGADAFAATQELLDDGWMFRMSPSQPKGRGRRQYHQPGMYGLSGKAIRVLADAS